MSTTDTEDTNLIPDEQPEPKSSARTTTSTSPSDDASFDGSDGRLWYIIHTYSGYENKVKKNLEHRILTLDMSDHIFRVEVPTVEEIEIKGGQRHTVPRKIFPGYVLVEM